MVNMTLEKFKETVAYMVSCKKQNKQLRKNIALLTASNEAYKKQVEVLQGLRNEQG